MKSFDSSEWVWPFPVFPGLPARKPQISDGFHAAGDKAFRGGVGHRGQDVMLRKRLPSSAKHPWSSKWYYVEENTPALACGSGVVARAQKLATGWCVEIAHGDGLGTTCHHLSKALVSTGVRVVAGQPIGIVGGSPIGYGLVHLHFDVKAGGKFQDAARWMRKWGYVTLDEAWGRLVVLGPLENAA